MTTKNIGTALRLCTHHTGQFKTSVLSVNIITPLAKNTAAKALLINLLARTNKQYPELLQMNRHLAELYGASVFPSITKLGEAQVLSLTLSCLDDRFSLENEAILESGIELLFACLFSPDITPDGFKDENIEREKRLLCEKIDSEKADKRIYALNTMLENMCCDEVYGISEYGTKQEINALTGKEIFSVWKDILFSCPIQVNVTGNFEQEKIEEIIKNKFSVLERKKENIIEVRTEFLTEAYDSKTVTQKQNVKQGKLVIGYRAGMTYEEDNFAAIKLMTAIFGGGTFSKLFMNVREKMSLCYYCSAKLLNSKGIITVQSGVETENAQKALKAIRKELDDVRQGNFSDETIESAKLSIIDTYKSFSDNVLLPDAWFKSHCNSPTIRTPEQLCEDIQNVSREEIILAANMITEDTVFILESEKEAE